MFSTYFFTNSATEACESGLKVLSTSAGRVFLNRVHWLNDTHHFCCLCISTCIFSICRLQSYNAVIMPQFHENWLQRSAEFTHTDETTCSKQSDINSSTCQQLTSPRMPVVHSSYRRILSSDTLFIILLVCHHSCKSEYLSSLTWQCFRFRDAFYVCLPSSHSEGVPVNATHSCTTSCGLHHE
jgi:hypothetical protein